MERGGILTNKGIQELKNIDSDPEHAFSMSPQDLEKLNSSNTTATFHTHPNAKSLLTNLDYLAFLHYPRLKHYIIGNDGIRCYRVHKGAVIEESKN